jgi:hypothetical protein
MISTTSARPSAAEQRVTLAADLAAARELYTTFDPDSPPWAIEKELRRLEASWASLAADSGGGRSSAGR